MAAELVGGAFLSSFLNVLFDRLSNDKFVNWIRRKKLDQNLLGRLENILNVVEAVLNDAEKKQITDNAVKRWLKNLQDAFYDADDLLDEVCTKAATQKDPGNFLSHIFHSQDRDIFVTRIEEVIARLEDIAKHKDILGLEKIAAKNMSGRIPSTSLVKKSDMFVGRDREMDTIVKLLLDDSKDGEISVIPIVGMGGIGKTTLAKLVYNDVRVKHKFHVKAWVCVGEEEFDVLKMTKIVIEKTGSSCHSNDLDTVQNHLKDKLEGKKFLVVVDDVWSSNREGWESFLTPFECGSEGGHILVTSRLDSVASMVKTNHIQPLKLSLLHEEDCCLVFAKHAFFPTESRDRSALEIIGRKIVQKCKGVPLAVQTLGGLLRTKDHEREWIDVLNSEIWEFAEDESSILPALRISYYYLPSYLKRCFVYCSLYPKDYEFIREELVPLWMAEGLLQQPKSDSTLEEVGYKYFTDLASRSFFQHSNSGENSFVMHDLMHDLAIFCGGKFFSRTFELKNAAKHDAYPRHLSYSRGIRDSLSKFLEACDDLQHARTLLKINVGTSHEFSKEIDPCRLLAQLKRVRVLSFEFFPGDHISLPDSIGDLIHLRYLDLSGTPSVTLPESMSNLYNLQTLKLSWCRRLKKLPSKMQDLVNLRHLDITETNLEEMPKGMSKLKELQKLSDYIVGKHEENGIGELGEHVHLQGKFCIKKLENVVDSSEAWKARMVDKKYITHLWLEWSSGEDNDIIDSQIEKEVLAKLEPHKDLKRLSLWGYRGTKFPDWIGQSWYHDMTWLELRGCRNCWVLPSLGQLPALMSLKISGCDKLKKIDGSFYKGDGTPQHQETPFRSLKYLIIERMPCWEEWESYECDDDDHAPFPQLATLWIQHCPKLRGDLPTFLPSLKSLYIRRCEEVSCYLPRAPSILKLEIYGKQEARMLDLPLSMLEVLWVNGEQQVEYVFEAMTHTQPTSLIDLHISECSSAISFPGDSLPPSLQQLRINNCKNVEFPMQNQQHESLTSLTIKNSCDSLTSLPAFPNLLSLRIERCENLTSLELSQSQSLRYLWIAECPKLKNIIRLPASLSALDIRECGLLGEGIERKDPHIWPSISHIPSIRLDGKLICKDSTS
ncbi:putative disease resistance RPP13-like protein 1 [Arachis hypogaea]|uniref:putative disease resistance RPP13-like protein 1 n=1 Tax=Arachis hypogaea TaxID=3818 RepID=UPI000DEC61FA|nr:putative disease resistance RPP13-like protein 1 [Arachis hypogaea]XP_029149315.1 putative disease resistance RPP13-like protein 1 [Arachis hypogaea]